MPEIIEADEFNPKKIFDALVERCKEMKSWDIRCIVDESWYINGIVPFNIKMKDGVYTCTVIAPTKKDALIKVADHMPVIKFLDNDER